MVGQMAGLARRATVHSVGLLLCALLTGVPAAAQEDPPGRVGRIAELQGEVWVFETEQGEWVPALRNRPFTQGDRLSTAAASDVRLEIGSTTLYLNGSSELEALRLDDEAMQLRLEQGSMALLVRSGEAAAELSVDNAEGRFVPVVAGLYRVDRFDERSDAMVWRGELRFESTDLSVLLHEDQRARFWQDGSPPVTRNVWLTPLDDRFAQSVLRADQTDSRSVAAPFVPAEMTGIEDLDRLGRWQQHPQYGAVWSPTVVTVGWAPYRFGQWIWLQPWGWTWVDDAPWGFAPFHYGRWLWWRNRWCWAPGPVVRRPVFAPALVAWSGAPVRAAGGPTPVVGWVPLAPHEPYRPAYRASPGHLQRLNPLVPQAQAPRPGYGNRGVPGAVTWLPAQAMTPRRPVADAALHGDAMAPRQWGSSAFDHRAPERPQWPQRERIAPRPLASPGVAAAPTTAPPPRPPVTARPGDDAAPVVGPFLGRPPRTPSPGVAVPERAAAPGAAPAAGPVAAPAAPLLDALPTAPARAHPVPPGPRQEASPRRPPAGASADGRNAPTMGQAAPGRAGPARPGSFAATPTPPAAPATMAPHQRTVPQPFKAAPTAAPPGTAAAPAAGPPVTPPTPPAVAPAARADAGDAASARQGASRDEHRGAPNSRLKPFER